MMTPKTEAELAETIASASAPLAIRGGGTRGLPLAGDPLDVSGLSGVTLYEPGALTIVAQAGTPVADIETALAAENQRLAFEPMDHRGIMGTDGAPTIGGVIAGNISGPRRIQGGAARDFLLGVRYVDGSGQVIRNGGRVMKNVTGYDLVKLMAGSWGTLGVLTEVALKVLPAVEAEETLVIEGLAPEQAVAVMSAAMSTPYDVSGAAHLGGDAPRTCVRLEGFGDSVAYRAKQLSAELGRFGAVSLAGAGSAALWQQIRDLAPFHGAEGDVWKISVKPSDGPAVVARLGGAPVVMDWAGGLVWALMPQGTNLRPLLGGIAGHATLVRGGPDTHARLGTFHPEAPGVAALSTGLRRRFDPRGLFNPGLMSAGKEA